MGGDGGGAAAGDGGAGGLNGNSTGLGSIDNAGPVTGGAGSTGGDAGSNSGGGGGGAGGYGLIVTGTTSNANSSSVAGGTGGNGGNGASGGGSGGNGGDGGVGIQFTAPGATLTNSGSISGGDGGVGGTGGFAAGAAGLGGAGIVGEGLHVINAGTIRGGFAGDFGPQADALTFTGGTNILELRSTSQIEGVARVAGGTGTLRLGGLGDGTFDVSTILGGGPQYVGFTAFEKTGTSTWVLTNGSVIPSSEVTPWTVREGTLAFSSNLDFGATSGRLTLDGGRLRVDAVNVSISTRPMTITANGGTIDTNGNALGINSIIDGPGGLTKTGAGILRLFSANTYTGGTTINAGTLQLISSNRLAAAGALTINGGIFDLNNNSQTVAALSGTGGTIALGSGTLTTNSAANTTLAAAITGSGQLIKQGSGTLVLTGTNTYGGGTTVSGGTLQGSTTSLQGNITNNAAVVFSQNGDGTYAGTMTGSGSLTKAGTGTLILTGANAYAGGTTVTGGLINFAAGNLGAGAITLNGGGLQWGAGNTTDISAQLSPLGAAGGTFDTNGNAVTLAGNIGGAGGLTKAGAGTLTLAGTSSYSGGTTVAGGTLQGTTASLQGNILNNANVTFDQAGNGTYAGSMSGTGSLTKAGTGTLILGGTNSYTGGTTVSGGILQGNSASLQGNILNNASVVFNQTGSGTYSGAMSGTGGMTLQGGGVLAMTGANTYTRRHHGQCQHPGGERQPGQHRDAQQWRHAGRQRQHRHAHDQRRHPRAGQLDRHHDGQRQPGAQRRHLPGRGQCPGPERSGERQRRGHDQRRHGAAGGRPRQLCQQHDLHDPQRHGRRERRLLGREQQLRVPDAVAVVQCQQRVPDPGAAGQRLLGLRRQHQQPARGRLCARPDLRQRLGRLRHRDRRARRPQHDAGRAGARRHQRPAICRLRHDQRGGRLAVHERARPADGERARIGGRRPAPGPGDGVRGRGLRHDAAAQRLDQRPGRLRQRAGQRQRIDAHLQRRRRGGRHRLSPRPALPGRPRRRLRPRHAVGEQLHGPGLERQRQRRGLWLVHAERGFYADALAGYAYFNNQMQRQIQIPGLQQRTASGSTGANQFLTQVETGYALPVFAPAALAVTPFARLQFSTTTQNAFAELGANALSLTVAQQTTNSLRTVLGAELASSIGLANQRQLDLAIRLGWQHEYADTGRPITAAFSGAPAASFTVYGATPTRDAAIIGLSAGTTVAEATPALPAL